jgi:hypothetical protein
MNLQPDEISNFQQNGFLGPIRAFTGNEIDRLLAPLDDILAETAPTHEQMPWACPTMIRRCPQSAA